MGAFLRVSWQASVRRISVEAILQQRLQEGTIRFAAAPLIFFSKGVLGLAVDMSPCCALSMAALGLGAMIPHQLAWSYQWGSRPLAQHIMPNLG
jgi:hypothetical protein